MNSTYHSFKRFFQNPFRLVLVLALLGVLSLSSSRPFAGPWAEMSESVENLVEETVSSESEVLPMVVASATIVPCGPSIFEQLDHSDESVGLTVDLCRASRGPPAVAV